MTANKASKMPGAFPSSEDDEEDLISRTAALQIPVQSTVKGFDVDRLVSSTIIYRGNKTIQKPKVEIRQPKIDQSKLRLELANAIDSHNMVAYHNLVREGADISAMGLGKGCTFLHIALVYENNEVAKHILSVLPKWDLSFQRRYLEAKTGLDVVEPLAPDVTALSICAGRPNPEILELLLKAGADPATTTTMGESDEEVPALMVAIMCADARGKSIHLKTVSLLLKALAMRVSKNPQEFGYPLHVAVKEAPAYMCRLLVSWFSVKIPDSMGQTPLHIAVRRGDIDIVKLVVSRDANVNAPDTDGDPPLSLAIWKKQHDIAAYLIDEGANLEVHGFKGRTPLHWACEVGFGYRLLIDRGADVNATDADGATPLHYAARGVRADIVDALLAAKAHILDEDNEGLIPRRYATNPLIMARLDAAEADIKRRVKELTSLKGAMKMGAKHFLFGI